MPDGSGQDVARLTVGIAEILDLNPDVSFRPVGDRRCPPDGIEVDHAGGTRQDRDVSKMELLRGEDLC